MHKLLITSLIVSVLPLIATNEPVAIRESSLLISTLDGTLHAVGQRSGLIKWSLNESPILKLPTVENVTQQQSRKTLFLPDPKDGSLYLYNGFSAIDSESERESLEKLPFTVSELVSSSPCRSSDGILYTGKKTDEWLTINAQTGQKVDVLNSETPMCPSPPLSTTSPETQASNLLFVGKSEYQLSIFDLNTKQKTWNLTFVDYSSSAASSIAQNAYELLHLTSSTTGRIATIDLSNDANRFLWTHQFSSPIVSIFQFNDGITPVLRRVPFSTIGGPVNPRTLRQSSPLYPALYVGEMPESKSMYALSTLVDLSQTALIPSKRNRKLLIEGPDKKSIDSIREYFNVLVFGYYEYPELIQTQLYSQFQISQTPRNNLLTEEKPKPLEESNIISNLSTNFPTLDVNNNYMELLRTIITFLTGVTMIAVIIYLNYRNSKSNRNQIRNSDSNSITVGKIKFDPKAIIGRGCSGTCVYKGLFENRQKVAVKRVVADHFVLADREIELLRSLQHPNLIRYFATESDDMFRYIAIELADFTLADYIERKNDIDSDEIDCHKLLHQSCMGLAHLHSLHVVHRDIKPQNILISLPLPPNNTRKVMISDFGVSKVLTSDHSFSTEVSAALKGTEGWIAPEVLKSKLERITFKPSKPIDIFSMGCLFYYSLSKGKHPFGDLLHRQSNILLGQFDINELKSEETLCEYSVIQTMLSPEPSARPNIEAVLKYPLFWDANKSLQFLQDVSDRIEKEPVDSPVVIELERGGIDVCKGDWRRHISIELQTDLKKFRSYRGSSVRDLLRAMRNKRHHYRELPPEVQQSLGAIPNEFVLYFTSRFPRLLIHSYIALQICRAEPVFESYYQTNSVSYESLPRSGIKWFTKNTENLMPNGVGSEDSLEAVNWKSCKRNGSPVKRIQVIDMSPKFEDKSHENNFGLK